MIEEIFIAIGSNIEAEQHVRRAIQILNADFEVLKVSQIYQSPAFGRQGQQDYLNAAVLVEAEIDPYTLKFDRLRGIEAQLGRKRSMDKFASRTIDLDIALFGQQIVNDPQKNLIIPDPGILRHPFISFPLADISEDFRHPITNQTLGSIRDNFLHLLGKEIHICHLDLDL